MSIIERATNAAESCILPCLNVQIGEQNIDERNFLEFQPLLKNNLQTFLDIFHANQHELLIVDLDTLEFRRYLILILCEQSTESVFQIPDIILKETLRNLCHNHVPKLCTEDERLLQNIFEYYQKVLNKENWKYNIGAIHSFLTFIHELYGCNISDKTNLTLDYGKSNFILATGLNFFDHFEPHIQIIGVKLFNILLNERNAPKISEYNIQEVIFDNTEKLIQKSKEIDFVSELWQCLLACCSLEIHNYKPETWSKFDDIYEQLIQKLAIENDKTLSMFYLSYVIRFSILGETKFDRFKEYLDINSLKALIQSARLEKDNQERFLEGIRSYIKENQFTNLRVFRWFKKILMLIQNEAFKIGGDELSVSIHLNELHLFYCLSIFTVPVQILNKEFMKTCTKFIATLLEVFQLFKNDYFICQSIRDFLITIQVHLKSLNDTGIDDPKIASLMQKLCNEQIQQESISEDVQECEKALTMLLNKLS